MLYLDGHCHFSAPSIAGHLPAILPYLAQCGIGGGIQGGLDPQDWALQTQQALAFPQSSLGIAVGIHPWTVTSLADESLQAMLESLPNALATAIALGELGLDYARATTTAERDRQKHYAVAQWRLAAAQHKPLVLHIVRAYDAMASLWHQEKLPALPALAHSFTGSLPMARSYVSRGICLSLGPRSLSPRMADVIRWLPWESLVVESDAPYTSYPPGSPRHANPWSITLPDVIWDVAAHIATLRGVTSELVLEHSTRNLLRLFPCLKEPVSP